MPVSDVADYYAVLEVPFGATTAEIQTAFRAKAKVLHPDKNPGRDTTAAFQNLLKAFETLRDPDARLEYDRIWRKRFDSQQSKAKSRQNSYTKHEYTRNENTRDKQNQNDNPKNTTPRKGNTMKDHSRKPSHHEKPTQDQPPPNNPIRDRLNQKLAQLLAREATLKQQRPTAFTSVQTHQTTRRTLEQTEPKSPKGPWYTAHRPLKRDRAVFTQNHKTWQTQLSNTSRALSAAETTLQSIDNELSRLEQEITNLRAEISIEALVDGVSAFASEWYPFAQTAFESVRGMHGSSSQVAAGALFGVAAAAAVSGLAWRFASSARGKQQDE